MISQNITKTSQNVAGLLVMTQNDVTFEPFKITDRENPDGKPALNTINDLIKHRMSLANQLFSASITDQNPHKLLVVYYEVK